MYPSSSPPPPHAASRQPASQSHPRRTGSISEPQPPQNTSLPSIRQLHPHLPPPPGIPPSIHPAEPLAPYTYPAPPHFAPHPSSSSTTTISSVAPGPPPPPLPQHFHHQSSPLIRERERERDRDRDADVYPMAESEIEDTEQPPKKKRRRQALSCTECKRRKIKCDRTQPCGPCSRRGEHAKCHWHVVEPVEKYVTRAEYDELKARFDQLEAMVLRNAPPGMVPPPMLPHPGQSSSSAPGTAVSLYHVGIHPSPPGDGSPPTAIPTHMIFPHAPPPPQHSPQQPQHGLGPSSSYVPSASNPHHSVPPLPHFDQGYTPQATSVPVRYDLHAPPHHLIPQHHQRHHTPPYESTSPSLAHLYTSPRLSSGDPGLGTTSSGQGMRLPSPGDTRSPPLGSSIHASGMAMMAPASPSSTPGIGSTGVASSTGSISLPTKKSPLSLAAITSPTLTSPRPKNSYAQMLKLGERLRLVGVWLSGVKEGPVAVVAVAAVMVMVMALAMEWVVQKAGELVVGRRAHRNSSLQANRCLQVTRRRLSWEDLGQGCQGGPQTERHHRPCSQSQGLIDGSLAGFPLCRSSILLQGEQGHQECGQRLSVLSSLALKATAQSFLGQRLSPTFLHTSTI